jgi:hypothetical protein
MSVPNPNPVIKNVKSSADTAPAIATSSVASAASATLSAASNPAASANAVSSAKDAPQLTNAFDAYQEGLNNLAKLQAKPDTKFKIALEKGAQLSQKIEAAPNYSSALGALMRVCDLSVPSAQSEIRLRQKNGVLIYNSTTDNDAYVCLVFSKEDVVANDFLSPKIYRIGITEKGTTILTTSFDLIMDEDVSVRCGNSELAFGPAGELNIVERPLTAKELHDSFKAAEENRCILM